MQRCAPTLKTGIGTLGGHAPFIVFEDADLDAAVEGLCNQNSGMRDRPASVPIVLCAQ